MNASETKNDLIFLFNKYFEVILADTQERLRQCWQLRYQVYCLESKVPGFYPDRYPEGLERDLYDERSVHSLLIHKPSGKIAGTVRVILPISGNFDARFPVEEFAGHLFYTDKVSLMNLSRSQLGEISRLIIAPKFRMRKGEALSVCGLSESADNSNSIEGVVRHRSQAILKDQNFDEKVQCRCFPHTILGLFVAIIRISAQYNLDNWCAGMEPVCARLLRLFGINFSPISPIVEYYGPRRCYFGNILDIMKGMYRAHPEIWALLTNNGVFFPGSRNSQ